MIRFKDNLYPETGSIEIVVGDGELSVYSDTVNASGERVTLIILTPKQARNLRKFLTEHIEEGGVELV